MSEVDEGSEVPKGSEVAEGSEVGDGLKYLKVSSGRRSEVDEALM